MDEKKGKIAQAEGEEKILDRLEFFRQARKDLMARLGIPEGTKPEAVLKVLRLHEELEKIKNKGKKGGSK
jgi:hypothetical protein